jgi:hypothetical protein
MILLIGLTLVPKGSEKTDLITAIVVSALISSQIYANATTHIDMAIF